MVITNPKDALRACESLIGHITELLVDIEGQARDGGLAGIEAQTKGLMQATKDVLADVHNQLARMNGAKK